MINIFKEASITKLTVTGLLTENPGHPLWKSIAVQLDFILQDFDDNGACLKSAPKSRVSELIIGVQAVREIEMEFPDLADALCNIDHAYKTQYGIQILG